MKFLSLSASLLAATLLVQPLNSVSHAQTAPSQSDRGKTIIVLDASGSMWGKVPGGVKIDVAREAVSELVNTLDPSIELGLMAYGHRQKGDCEDIELLVPPGAGTRDGILKAVRSLIPKGKTPLSDAVLQAADILKFEEGKATVILVSDGIETCGKDPCAVGDALAARGIDFKCHVVGFDLSPEERKNIECLATKTGGLYLDANDAQSLKDSLNKAVEAVVMAETDLLLYARNEDGQLLNGVKFGIYGDKADEEPLFQGSGGKYRQKLEPGTYQIAGTFGALKASGEVTVPEGKTTPYELTFKASGLKATAYLNEGGSPIEQGLSWKIFDKPESDRSRKPVAYSYHAIPTFHIPSGDYFLRVTKEETTVEKQVTVEEGKGSEIHVVLGSGILAATARMSDTDPLIESGLSWKLMGQPDAEGDRKQIAYSYESKTNLVAPAGSYLLTVKYGNAYSEKEVELKAGETVETTLTFGAGTLIANAVMSEAGEPVEESLSWKLLSGPNAEGERTQVSYSYNAAPEFKVPSGEYLLTLKRGSATTEEEVAVAVGEPTKVTLNLNGGFFTAQAFMSEDVAEPADDALAWKVLSQPDAEGNRESIKNGYEGSPNYFLPAGRYLVQLRRGSANTEKEITIEPAKITTEKFILNAGTMLLKAPAGADRTAWRVYALSAEGEKGDQLGHSYSEEFRLYLPAGECIAELKVGSGDDEKTLEKKFTVVAGKFAEIQFQ